MDKVCSYPGCGRRTVAKNLCKPHYYQQRSGKELTPLRVYTGPVECDFEGCSNTVLSKGLCRGHYQQRAAGKGLAPLRRARLKAQDRDDTGRKQCSGCREWLGVEQFSKASAALDGLNSRCKACIRQSDIAARYNLSADAYREMLSEQGGTCAICKGDPEDVGTLHVDHDHACCPKSARSCGTCIRGLLCNACNTSLGLLRGDLVEWADAADTYLRDGQ